MTDVTRYRPPDDPLQPTHTVSMVEDEAGGFVRYADHDAAVQGLREQQAAMCRENVEVIAALQQHVAELELDNESARLSAHEWRESHRRQMMVTVDLQAELKWAADKYAALLRARQELL